MIERTFQNIQDGKLSESGEQSFLMSLGWSRGKNWQDLLKSKRVLIVSEAGAGKTYECQNQAKRMWELGEPAFYVELAALASEDLTSLLDTEEEARLNSWLTSQSEIATFFVDSIDELKLTRGSFEHALKRLKKGIKSKLYDVRIIITTRPTHFDEEIIRRLLPIPHVPPSKSPEVVFAEIAMGGTETAQRKGNDYRTASEWQKVALMPLSDNQIIEFAKKQNVDDPSSLMEDLVKRNAQDFARRPQDLIELCSDWREHKHIRTHFDQVLTNIRVKLCPRSDRAEAAELSLDRALEGASRLALAVQTMRRFTIRHSVESDNHEGEAALNPTIILSDWQPNEIKALLERPLFGFASYGRVRFHHRSVWEFLASERLDTLLKRGMPFRSLRRLLFVESKGKTIVRPSKRAVAGWLALKQDGLFELLLKNEPSVLLDEGDPESLASNQRKQAIHAYCRKYGSGGWRGLEVPTIQIHRFASKELGDDINKIWSNGIENPDVREVLITLIGAGRIASCSEIAFHTACERQATFMERLLAIEALVALNDKRLIDISISIAAEDSLWSDQIAQAAVTRLFPKYMSAHQLCRTLGWVKHKKRSIGGLFWELPRIIECTELEYSELTELRNGLLKLMREGLQWKKEDWPHITNAHPYLSGVLAAVCAVGLIKEKTKDWLYASVLAIRLRLSDQGDDESLKTLRERLRSLTSKENECLFWAEDNFISSLHKAKGPGERLSEITFEGAVHLTANRDLSWILDALKDPAQEEDRAMLLEAAVHLSPEGMNWRTHVENLKPLVSDQTSLLDRIDEYLEPSEYEEMQRERRQKDLERKEKLEKEKSKNHESWVEFWREIAHHPDIAFSSEQEHITAWNLWRAMSKDGDDRAMSGWNRHFIEKYFDKGVADQLRHTLMSVWRKNSPTFPYERQEKDSNGIPMLWQLGLAGIYAEAEDSEWARRLTADEARLAVRHLTMESNGLPPWMGELVESHSNAVEPVLGPQLTWEIIQPPGTNAYSQLIHGIHNSSETVARLFIHRLESWFDSGKDKNFDTNNSVGMSDRIRQVTGVILKHGSTQSKAHLLDISRQRIMDRMSTDVHLAWMSILMQIDPEVAVTELEDQLANVAPSERSDAVIWLANLFGNRRNSIGLGNEEISAKVMLKLLRFAYRHVRLEDDAVHEGSYTPDVRDDAEHARNAIVNAMLNLKGEDGLSAKLEMASDPLCNHFRDRILALAEENWAHELDSEVYEEEQVIVLDRTGEAPASTNEAMFSILRDRLYDLDDLLLTDTSPREAWSGIKEERVMRRVIAHELRHASNAIYTVDQEAVTADEKETDIRLRSTVSDYEAVIELKLGDERPANDLLNTIEDQLVKKYLGNEKCRSGVLLVALSRDRKWKHPDKSRMIAVDELIELLRVEAKRVHESSGRTVLLDVHLLDLRPRLLPESES